jgi:hypothetical protein
MKRNSLSIGALIGALALSSSLMVWAADDAKPEAPARRANAVNPLAGLKSAVDDLKLSGDAKAKADEILAKAQEEADKATKEAAGDRRAGLQRTSEIVKSAAEKISAILDEDQKLMLRSKLQGAAKPGGNEAGAGGGGRGGR